MSAVVICALMEGAWMLQRGAGYRNLLRVEDAAESVVWDPWMPKPCSIAVALCPFFLAWMLCVGCDKCPQHRTTLSAAGWFFGWRLSNLGHLSREAWQWGMHCMLRLLGGQQRPSVLRGVSVACTLVQKLDNNLKITRQKVEVEGRMSRYC